MSGTEIWGKEDGSVTYTNLDHDEFSLTYKGTLDELITLETLEFSYETSSGREAAVTKEFDVPPTEITFKIEGKNGTGSKVYEDDVIIVNVNWDSNKETFELNVTEN